MKDKHNNRHLRPYALAALAISFLATTALFVTLVVSGQTNNMLINGFSLGVVCIIATGSATAGCSLHDKHYLSLAVRSIAFITITSAVVSIVLSALALWDVLGTPLVWNMAAICTILALIGGALSLLVPLYIGAHTTHRLVSVIIVATMVSSIVCFVITTGYILQLAFVPQQLYPRLIAATAAPTVLGLLLLPIVLHFLHIKDHIHKR